MARIIRGADLAKVDAVTVMAAYVPRIAYDALIAERDKLKAQLEKALDDLRHYPSETWPCYVCKHRDRPVLVNGEIDETSPCRRRTRGCFEWDEHARDEQRRAHEVVMASMPQGMIAQGGVISEQKAKRARISEVQYAAPSYIR